jgi:hypothetical protein
MIAFDFAHPCLTFDKWRVLALVNSAYDVVDFIQTFFLFDRQRDARPRNKCASASAAGIPVAFGDCSHFALWARTVR